MKTKIFLLLVGVGVGGLAFAEAPKKADKPVFHLPQLKLDTSALNEGKAPVLSSYADVLEGVRPAVVSVYSSKIVREEVPQLLRQLYGPNLQGREQKLEGLGSGVIISPDGYILTNNHVVDAADELKVALNDGRELIAKVVGTDPKTDVAIIKIEADKLPALTLADSDRARVGDIVFAIGNPLGVGQTVTMGIISATGRRVGILSEVKGYEDFIQTDASINRGNSGGALVDAKGRLVGINSAIVSPNQGSIGIGFAIPINLARGILGSLIENGSVTRGYLGVSTNPEPMNDEIAESLGLPPGTRGALVTALNPADGPAAKAGVKRGDVIVAVNDKPVATNDDLRLIISQTPPGTKVNLTLMRKGKSQTVTATLGLLDDEQKAEVELLAGVTLKPLTEELRREVRLADDIEGVLITEIDPQSPFARIFPVGAVIEEINGRPVATLADLKAGLTERRNRALIYYRGLQRYVFFGVR